ncbi:KH domain-containing protein akap-1-like [Lytechinus variegatus]|uniref:KH domain-containing protein akap-1-like n=1 Tax=Lytechinus variegatus TaxID=7654 RepID=UPI001BB27EA5|nr:KH domain-containing protein akap-1-like [Lytechinus variegatus]XP_041465410.1 KH domain-containing protein akap-1-like [Lytechinus variegatus]XP_041465411.1 KH domain-containing protein akap-1-like [Lytechinus variegatus]
MDEMRSNTSTSSGRSIGTSMSKKNQQKLSLEITWKSLDQERQHFLKLMALNEKLLRNRQEKRDNRIAHLQSHLTAPQIAEIETIRKKKKEPKRLAAAERSSLEEADVESPRGIDSPDGVSGGKDAPSCRTIQSLTNDTLGGRSRSFYGHERSTDSRVASDSKCDTPLEVVNNPKEKSVTFLKERTSQSAPKIREKSFTDTPLRTHPPTRSLLKPNKSAMTRSTPNLDQVGIKPTLNMSTVPSRMRASSSSSSPSTFSCHEESKREMERRRSRSVGSSDRSRTPLSPGHQASSSVFRDAMDAIKKERTRTDMRNLMVIENGLQLMHLQRRKDELIAEIGEMVKRDRDFAQRQQVFRPPSPKKKVTLTSLTQAELINAASQGADINDLRKEIRRRKNERMRERMKMDIPADQLKRKDHETEDEYAKRIEKWWRDMRKVRYLRRASTKQDFSDVVTLAMAQKNNDNIWRQSLRDNLF